MASSQKAFDDKDHILQSENISISQNFITCVFCNLHFLAESMYQKYIKNWKICKKKCMYIIHKKIFSFIWMFL